TAMARGGGFIWVTNSGDGTISQIDPQRGKVVHTYHLGNRPAGISYAGGHLWVSVSKGLSASTASKPSKDVLRLSLFPLHPGPDSTDPGAQDNFLGSGGLWDIAYATCAKLLNYPDKPGKDGLKLEPELAKSMPTVSNAGKTYTFAIRQGITFSPPYQGVPVTASSFQHAIERALNPRLHAYARQEGFLDDVVGAQAYENGRAPHISGIATHGNQLTITLLRPS